MKIFVSFLVASGLAQNANEYYYDYDTANNDTANYDTTNYDTAEWVPESALPQGKADAYATAPTGAMTCWHCDAMTFEECEANGQERECHDNEVTISIITQYIQIIFNFIYCIKSLFFHVIC